MKRNPSLSISLVVISKCSNVEFLGIAYAIAFAPKCPVLLLANIKLSSTQLSPVRYLPSALQPLNDILLAVKSRILKTLFSRRCSVIVNID